MQLALSCLVSFPIPEAKAVVACGAAVLEASCEQPSVACSGRENEFEEVIYCLGGMSGDMDHPK